MNTQTKKDAPATASSRDDLAYCHAAAQELHLATGHAPVEVSMGKVKVKIGGWLSPEVQSLLGDAVRATVGMVSAIPHGPRVPGPNEN